MKETERLIQLITRFGPPKLPLLNQATPKIKTLEDQLFENIKVGKYKNEEEALLDLYGSEDDYHKYRMLKSRLKQKLYNHVLFAERDTIIAKREEKQCLDWAYKGKSLVLLGEYNLAKKQFEKTIKLAIQYEFTEIVIDCLEKMAFISAQVSDIKLFKKASTKLEHFRAIKKAEDEAATIFYLARLNLSNTVASNKNYLNTLSGKVDTLKKLWKRSSSFNVFQKYYLLSNWYLNLIGDFENEIQNIQECEEQLKAGKINKFRFDRRLNKYIMANALLRTKKYEEGLLFVEKNIHMFSTDSRNRLAFQEFQFLLALHSGQNELAKRVLLEVEALRSNITLRKSASENWALYKAFLFFVSRDSYLIEFNYAIFINSVPEGTKDKLGDNISILILQFLYLLKQKDYEQLTSKEETFRKYANTYLKDQYSARSYYVFKLMLCIIRADFDQEKSIQRGNSWLKKLKNTPAPGYAFSNVEIVPYEKLWEVMLGYLEDK